MSKDEFNDLVFFETLAELYHKRYHRLAPGKSEPFGFRDSNEPENRKQYDEWYKTQSLKDAIMFLANSLDTIEKINEENELLKDTLQGILDFCGEPLYKCEEQFNRYKQDAKELLKKDNK
jgi:hypothetical protein